MPLYPDMAAQMKELRLVGNKTQIVAALEIGISHSAYVIAETTGRMGPRVRRAVGTWLEATNQRRKRHAHRAKA